jgi:elongation factor P--(R)-beta-lysine ligase
VTAADWGPTADLAALQRRALALAQTRAFFAARGLLEVETPIRVQAAASDPQIEPVALAGGGGFLHTSPEYAMKRLLAAGLPDLWQLCRVFRAGERSRLHNPEFTLLEWYRRGLDLDGLMRETCDYVRAILGDAGATRVIETISYREAFRRELQLDPLVAPQDVLAAAASAHGLVPGSIEGATRDELLDFLVSAVVGPRLGRGGLACLHHYPASQAALAALDPHEPDTALRFELYADGIELANGYVELADAEEQARRFAADEAERRRRGLAPHAGDPRLLAALRAGLPPCAGVALGFDRLMMVALGAASLDAVIALPWERA